MFLQLMLNFVLPFIILTRFSSEEYLGPIGAMLIALAFPIALEIANIYKRRKFSLVSIIAIVGILTTGAISLLGLSEGWLAVRRSVSYLAVPLLLVFSQVLKRPLIELALPHIIQMEKIHGAAKQRGTLGTLKKHIHFTSYLVSALFLAIAAASYILTRVIIKSPPGTVSFNEEYARLRLLSLPYTTLPLLVGIVVIIMYLLAMISRDTGLEPDELTVPKK
jgi:hypothetical protein